YGSCHQTRRVVPETSNQTTFVVECNQQTEHLVLDHVAGQRRNDPQFNIWVAWNAILGRSAKRPLLRGKFKSCMVAEQLRIACLLNWYVHMSTCIDCAERGARLYALVNLPLASKFSPSRKIPSFRHVRRVFRCMVVGDERWTIGDTQLRVFLDVKIKILV